MHGISQGSVVKPTPLHLQQISPLSSYLDESAHVLGLQEVVSLEEPAQ